MSLDQKIKAGFTAVGTKVKQVQADLTSLTSTVSGKANSSHTHSISDVTNLQTTLNAKAPLASPALTGTPTAPTAASGTNTTQIATTAFVTAAIAAKDSVGTATSAGKLSTGRKISLSGDASGSTTFDGSTDVTLSVTVKDDSHAHIISNVDGLQDALDNKLDATGKAASAFEADSANSVTWGNVSGKPTSFTPASHNQASSTINALTGYSKPSSTGALSTTDTLNSALGKLEKALDDKLSSSGNASTATSAGKWTTARTITLGGDASGSVTIDGSENKTLTVTVKDDSHAHVISNVDGLQDALDGKASTSSVTDAIATAKSYTDTAVAGIVDSSPEALNTLNELAAALGDDPNFATTVSTQIGTKANSSEVVKLSGNQTIAGTKTFSSTISGSINGNAATATKATKDASGNVITNTYATKTELTNGLAGKLGSTANAASASKWATARTITLAGDASGSVSIDGSANKTLTVTVADDSHNHVISNVDGLQTALDGKSNTDHTHRFYTSLIPYGTQITASESAPVDLNTVEYMKVGNYYCSSNASAEFITNLPKTKTAFMMAVYSPLSQTVDNETGNWVYRLRKISFYTGEEFIQYCYTNGSGVWSYQSWEQIITSKSPASTSVLGPVKVGSNITVSSGTISLTKDNVTTALGYIPPTKDTTYSAATSAAAGLMSASDKAKLDGIEAGANKFTYTLPTAGSTLGGVKTTSTVTSTSGLTACPIISGVPYYKDTNTTYTLSTFGITATASELNVLDGITANVTELNFLDGVTSNVQTQLNGKLATTGTAAKATADASGNTITSTYATKTELSGKANAATTLSGYGITDAYTKTQSNKNYLGWNRGALNVNTTYNGGLFMVAEGSNVPCGSNYGVFLSMPYRGLTGNSKPDFGAQIFIPNGDDATKPNSMFFRTSLGDTWNSWQEVASVSYADSTYAKKTDVDLSKYFKNTGGTISGATTIGGALTVKGQATVSSLVVSGTVSGIKYSSISGTPTLAAVATSGSYNDLTNKPSAEVHIGTSAPTNGASVWIDTN